MFRSTLAALTLTLVVFVNGAYADRVQAAMGLVRGLAGSGYHITVVIPYFDQPNNQ